MSLLVSLLFFIWPLYCLSCHLAFVLAVLSFTVSDYPFGICKQFVEEIQKEIPTIPEYPSSSISLDVVCGVHPEFSVLISICLCLSYFDHLLAFLH